MLCYARMCLGEQSLQTIRQLTETSLLVMVQLGQDMEQLGLYSYGDVVGAILSDSFGMPAKKL